MYKLILAISLSLSLLCAAPLTAATQKNENSAKAPKAAAVATPAPKKESFWKKIWPFDHSKKKSPTPKQNARQLLDSVSHNGSKHSEKKEPTHISRHSRKNESHSVAETEKKAQQPPQPAQKKSTAEHRATKPEQKITAAKKETHIPISDELHRKKSQKKNTQFSKPISFVPENNAPSAASNATPRKDDLVAIDAANRAKFEALKAKALKDPKIEALKQKADSALTISEATAASKVYYHALFAKIQKLGDASMQSYIRRMKSAIMERLVNN